MTTEDKGFFYRAKSAEEFFQALDLTQCPWPLMQTPPFREWEKDDWSLRRSPPVQARGYFSGVNYVEPGWVLRHKETVWMSLTPMELESQSPHVAAAEGKVLIGGGGMGVVAWNCAMKENVESVLIVERDPGIMLMLNHMAYEEQWPQWREKVKMVNADMLEYTPTERFDVAIIDIWPFVGDDRLRPDMQKIVNNVCAEKYLAWGIELDFITWCMAKGIHVGEIAPHHWGEYAQDIDVPLATPHPHMAILAVQAAMQMVSATLTKDEMKSIANKVGLRGG